MVDVKELRFHSKNQKGTSSKVQKARKCWKTAIADACVATSALQMLSGLCNEQASRNAIVVLKGVNVILLP